MASATSSASSTYGGAVFRLHQTKLFQHGLEKLPVFGPVDAFRLGPHDGHPGLARHGQVERGLAAELYDDAVGLLRFDDVEHIFPGQGLEVELVGGVVIGADRFGLLLTMMLSTPSSRRAKEAWTQQ
jgi:hypothetical protein